MELNRLNLVFPILVVALILSLFGCGGTSSTPSEGVFGSQWGTEGSGDGEFNWPQGVAVASDGSVYVSDSKNNRIQKFAPGP
jgi:DNA-binding beta-propeller fold protein YncE